MSDLSSVFILQRRAGRFRLVAGAMVQDSWASNPQPSKCLANLLVKSSSGLNPKRGGTALHLVRYPCYASRIPRPDTFPSVSHGKLYSAPSQTPVLSPLFPRTNDKQAFRTAAPTKGRALRTSKAEEALLDSNPKEPLRFRWYDH